MNKRLFLAINLPLELKEKIFETFSKKLPKDLKIVKKENIHLTLLFIGYYPEEKIAELKEKLSEIEFNSFELKLNSLGTFNGRVIWLGAVKGKEKFKELSEKIQEKIGVKDNRISAHLTLARNKFLKLKEIKELISKINAGFNETILVKSFELMESKLTPKGSIYFIEASFKLT